MIDTPRADPSVRAPRGAFGAGTAILERISGTVRRAVIVAVLGYPVGTALYLNFLSHDAASLPIDFVAFWSAASLAAEGEAVSAYDHAVLRVRQMLPEYAADAYFPWLYPGQFLLLLTPLGLLPFSAALGVFLAGSLSVYVLGLAKWRAASPGGAGAAWNLAIGAPAVLSVAFAGNVSLLWAGLFLFALRAIANGRVIAAGLFLALLTFKPQLGLMIPVALAAAGNWRMIAAAAGFTVLLLAITTAVFGTGHWTAFVGPAAHLARLTHDDPMLSSTLVTWYGLLLQVGAEVETALSIQAGWLLASAAAVAMAWRRSKPAGIDLQIATLAIATLTAAPRAHQYELLLATVAAYFLARAGVGQSVAGRLWLAVLWLLPVPGRLMIGIDPVLYAPPILGLSLCVCAWLALVRGVPERPFTSA